MTALECLTSPLSFAITPIFLKIWAEKGEKETSIFLGRCLRFFLMIALPCVFGLNYLGRDLTVLLASGKFEQAYKVIPFVSWGLLFFGLTNIFNAGLFIQKRSNILAIWTVIAGVINILLNIILIPMFGFVGSAIATLVSYLFLFLILAYKSFRFLSFPIDYRNIAKYLLFSLIMIILISLFKLNFNLLNIISKFAAGTVIYLSLILVFDKDIKIKVKSFFSKKGDQG
jgi:O-antigen/teichoic acid export membrane protein